MADTILDNARAQEAGLPNIFGLSGDKLFAMYRSLEKALSRYRKSMDAVAHRPHSAYMSWGGEEDYERERKNFSAILSIKEWFEHLMENQSDRFKDETLDDFETLKADEDGKWSNDAHKYSYDYADAMQAYRDRKRNDRWLYSVLKGQKMSPFDTALKLNELRDGFDLIGNAKYHFDKDIEEGDWMHAIESKKKFDDLFKPIYDLQMELYNGDLPDLQSFIGAPWLINYTPDEKERVFEDFKPLHYRSIWPYVRRE